MALVEVPIINVFVKNLLYESAEVDVFFFDEVRLFFRDSNVFANHTSVYDVYFKYFLVFVSEKSKSNL